jgi:predicted O-methyltransferase YrrM
VVRRELLKELLGATPQLPWSDWAMHPDGLAAVAAEVVRGRREIVECGSGLSTVAMARLLAGEGRLHALEHDPGWADRVRAALAAQGLTDRARIVEAPLRPLPSGADGGEWYEEAALEELPAGGIDLLLVDGPPAADAGIERRRYPALGVLADRLTAGALVVLDDAARPGEQWVLDAWERETPYRFDRRGPGGIATGQRV